MIICNLEKYRYTTNFEVYRPIDGFEHIGDFTQIHIREKSKFAEDEELVLLPKREHDRLIKSEKELASIIKQQQQQI